MIEVAGLRVVLPPDVVAVDGIDLAVSSGEFVVILGRSGSGKTTFLRALNRLVEPTAGRVSVAGRAVTGAGPTELRAARRQIGMIFQQFNLVRRASVFGNVLAGRLGSRPLWRTIFFRPTRDDLEAVFENLGRVGIVNKAYARADALSGGQQQRVGIARALMQEPDLMLADEPVVVGVGHLGGTQHVVAVVVVLDLGSQLVYMQLGRRILRFSRLVRLVRRSHAVSLHTSPVRPRKWADRIDKPCVCPPIASSLPIRDAPARPLARSRTSFATLRRAGSDE